MRIFFLMAGVQFAQYVVLTVNFRAIAHAQYLAAGATAGAASVLAYVIVRMITKDDEKSRYGLAGMVVGGMLADMFGIWLTRGWD